MRFCFFSIFSYFTIALTCEAQNPLTINFTVKDGLPSNEIHDLEFDEYGRLWMATEFGVSVFDGYEIKNHYVSDGLASAPVFEIFKDNLNRMWCVGGSGELSIIENGEINSYQYNDKILDFKGNNYNLHSDFHVDQNNLVFISFYEVGKLRIDSTGNVSRFHSRVSHNDSQDLQVESIDDSALFFTVPPKNEQVTFYDSVVAKLKIPNRKPLNIKRGKSTMSYDFFNSFYLGDTLVVSFNEYIYVIRNNRIILEYKFDTPIIKITQHSDKLWFSHHSGGVLVFKRSSFLKDTLYHILPGKIVTDVRITKSGEVWISTVLNGLYCIPNMGIKHIGSSNGLKERNITSICYHGNFLLCGGKEGNIYKIKNEMVVRTYPGIGRVPGAIQNIAVKYNKILSLSDNRVYINEEGKPASTINCLGPGNYDVECKVKNWRLTESGELILLGKAIFILDDNLNRKFIFDAELSSYSFKHIVVEDDNWFWVATPTGLQMLKDNRLTHIDLNNKLLKTQITSMERLNDRHLIFGSNGSGLILFDTKSMKSFMVNSNLIPPGNRVNDILVAGDESCWIATVNGLYYVQFKSKDLTRPLVRKYAEFDGLSSNEINQVKIHNDTLILATSNGISIIPKKILMEEVPRPRLLIEKLIVNDREILELESLRLNYDQNRIRIHYSGVDLRCRGKLTYWYRLKGSDDTWHSTTERYINYNGLPHGAYTFELKTINKDGIESNIDKKLSFIIQPPFWRTWWFIAIGIIILLSVAGLITRKRVEIIKRNAEKEISLNQERSEMEMLALRAQMNPHFIFNTINSIQYLINSSQNDKAEYFLEKFSKLLRGIVDHGLNVRVKISDEIDMLRTYLDLQNLRFDHIFVFDFHIDESIDTETTFIPAMILQPFIENAIQHGLLNKKGQGIIELKITREGKNLKFSIEDNGIGRKKAAKIHRKQVESKGSIGLKNIIRRVELIHGEAGGNYISVVDLYDDRGNPAGTRVVIELKEEYL